MFLVTEIARHLLIHRSTAGSGNLVQNWQIWVKSMRENALAALFRDLGYKIAFYPANKNISITSTAFDPQKNVFNEYLKMEAIELSFLTRF